MPFLAEDDFESYSNTADVQGFYGVPNVSGGFSPTGGRAGSKAWTGRITVTAGGGGSGDVVGMWFAPGVGRTLCEFVGAHPISGDPMTFLTVRLTNSEELILNFDSGGGFGDHTATLPPPRMVGVGRYLEIQYNADTGAGFLRVAVEGTRVYTYSGATAANNPSTKVLVGGTDTTFDDFYIRVPRTTDYLGNPIDYFDMSEPADFVGDYRLREELALDPDTGTGSASVDQQFWIEANVAPRAHAVVDQQYWIVAVGGVIPDVPEPSPPPVPTRPTPVQARGGAVYLDSFLEYDGRHVATPDGLFPGVYVTLSGGTTWGAGETLTLTTLFDVFTADDVGNVIIIHVDD